MLEGSGHVMNDREQQHPWGERLAAEGAAAADEPSLRRLLGDAVGVVKGRLGVALAPQPAGQVVAGGHELLGLQPEQLVAGLLGGQPAHLLSPPSSLPPARPHG